MHHRKCHDRLLSRRDVHCVQVMPLSLSLVLTQQATRRRLASQGLLPSRITMFPRRKRP